jgi:hypothetical protein
MMDNRNLPELVAANVRLAQKGQLFNTIVFEDSKSPVRKNEFLFFIKPEITQPSETIRLDAVLEMIFDKLKTFSFVIHRIRVISSDYLKQYDLIDQHYQVISDVSKHGVQALNSKAKNKFRELYQVNPEDVQVLGGVQFLQRYPFFNALSLDCLWQNCGNSKLAGGAYSQKIHIDRQDIYLLNGFHPRQLVHFNEKGRSLVVFRISSDISWKSARESFAGVTIPTDAADGSLRHTLLERKEEFGIPEVAQSYNGIHLSAGPVEALVELKRFDSDIDGSHLDYTDFSFGEKLQQVFGVVPKSIIENVKVDIDGRCISVFDLTEDVDADQSLALLKNAFV